MKRTIDDNTRLREEATLAARDLLQRYKSEHPRWDDDRTPIDDLVSWLDIAVATFHPSDQPAGTYGFLEPNEDLIWLCRNLAETLRRFTLAHELGHAILHRGASQHVNLDALAIARQDSQPIEDNEHDVSPSQDTVSHDNLCLQLDVREEVRGPVELEQMQEQLGPGISYDPRSDRELSANIFAAELLMPLARVRALYFSEQVPPNTLANLFGVSHSAMLNRLAGLLEDPTDEDDHLDTSQQRNAAGNHKGLPLRMDALPNAAKKQYDEFQRAAIEAPTPALIVAGPGSGKTSTLIGRAEYLVDTLGVAPEHILALTFSRKAAEEMADRLGQVLQDTSSGFPT